MSYVRNRMGLGDPCVSTDADANPIQCAINQLLGSSGNANSVTNPSPTIVTGPAVPPGYGQQNVDQLAFFPVETNTGGNAISSNIINDIAGAISPAAAATGSAAATPTVAGLPWYTWVAIGLAGLFVVGVAFPPKR